MTDDEAAEIIRATVAFWIADEELSKRPEWDQYNIISEGEGFRITFGDVRIAAHLYRRAYRVLDGIDD